MKLPQVFFPPSFQDPELDRESRLLHGFLWFALLIALAFAAVVSILLPANLIRALGIVVFVAVSGFVCFPLIYRGKARRAAYLFVFLFWLVVSALSVTGGGTAAPAFVGYIVVFLSAGLLLGVTPALGTAALCVVTEIVVAYAEANALLPTDIIRQTVQTRLVAHVLFFAFVAAIVFLFKKGLGPSTSSSSAGAEEKAEEPRRMPTILIAIFLVFSLGLIVSGYFYSKYQSAEIARSAEAELLNIAKLKVSQVKDWQRERLGDAHVLSENLSVSAILQLSLSNPSDRNLHKDLAQWLESVQKNYGYSGIVLFDPIRRPIVQAGEFFQTWASDNFASLFDSSAQTGRTLFSDLHEISGREQFRLDLLSPVFNHAGTTLLGVLLLQIDPDRLLFPLVQNWPVQSRTSESDLIRIQEGGVIFLTKPRFGLHDQTKKLIPISRSRLSAFPFEGHEEIMRDIDYRGEPVFAAVQQVQDFPWYLIVKEDEEEIFEPLRKNNWSIGLLVVFLILGAGGGVGFLWQNNSALFYRRQYRLESERRLIGEQFDNLRKYANDIIILIDSADLIVEANDRAVSAYGYTYGELIGMNKRELRPPEARTSFDRDVEKARASGGSIYETIHRRKDGSLFPVEISSREIDLGGKRFHQGIIRDITERRHAEENLRESERQLKEAQQVAMTGSSRWDAQTDVTVWSDEMFRITGWDPAHGAPSNSDRAKLYTPESYALLQQAVARALQAGDPYELELEIIRPDGERRHVVVRGRAYRDEHKSIGGLLGTMQDITERKQTEALIREREVQYRELVESARDAIYTVSTGGLFTSINAAFESATGWKREEWIGKPFMDVIHPDDVPRLADRFKRTIAGEALTLDEVRVKTKTGSFVLVELSSVPQTRDGKVIGSLGIGRDVTERRQLEEQLRRTQRLDSIGSLASGIAHDLNNVLGPILLSIDVLQRKLTDSSAAKMLETIRSSTKRGSEIVKQVLAFARGSEQEFSPQQLRYAVSEIQSFVRQTFPKAVTIRIDIPKDLPAILGDSTQLHQILLNLCVNARDAMPSGGLIRISASVESLGMPDLQDQPNAAAGEYVCLAVADTGTGIPEEVRSKIFDPFFTTKEVGKGTGLGLSTVNAIVRGHKGFLRVETEVGKGTTFKIFFPALQGDQTAAEEDDKRTIPPGNDETILVVDDEKSVLHIARETLEAYNYKVFTATDGVEATLLFNREPKGSIALVVSDVSMPRMGGVDLVQILRNTDPHVAILLTSGTPGEIAQRRAELINYRFLSKPFTADQLLIAIHELLHGGGQAEGSA